MSWQSILGLIMLLVLPALLIYSLHESWWYYPLVVVTLFLFGYNRKKR